MSEQILYTKILDLIDRIEYVNAESTEEVTISRTRLVDALNTLLAIVGGGLTIGGSSGDIQFNNSGALDGITGFTGTVAIPGVATLTITKGVITNVA